MKRPARCSSQLPFRPHSARKPETSSRVPSGSTQTPALRPAGAVQPAESDRGVTGEASMQIQAGEGALCCFVFCSSSFFGGEGGEGRKTFVCVLLLLFFYFWGGGGGYDWVSIPAGFSCNVPFIVTPLAIYGYVSKNWEGWMDQTPSHPAPGLWFIIQRGFIQIARWIVPNKSY